MTDRYDLSRTLLPYPGDLFPIGVSPNHVTPATEQDGLDPAWTYQMLERTLGRDLFVYGNEFLIDDDNPMVQKTARMITPTQSLELGHEMILRWRGEHGIVRCPPDSTDLDIYDSVATDIPLLNGFRLPIEELLQQDRRATLVLTSPNAISGRVHTPLEIARLANHFSMVVIDERLAGFSMRRLTPMINEWNNLIAIERMPFVMPGQTRPFAWFTHAVEWQETIAAQAVPPDRLTLGEVNRFWYLDPKEAQRRSGRLKGQLYRELRKLSLVSVPYPSWANFLLARIERGTRDQVVAGLAERGIGVYVPPQENLRQHIRITAVSSEATNALKQALIDINREI